MLNDKTGKKIKLAEVNVESLMWKKGVSQNKPRCNSSDLFKSFGEQPEFTEDQCIHKITLIVLLSEGLTVLTSWTEQVGFVESIQPSAPPSLSGCYNPSCCQERREPESAAALKDSLRHCITWYCMQYISYQSNLEDIIKQFLLSLTDKLHQDWWLSHRIF